MIAPSTPVSTPKRRGSRNTPDQIIEPTTIAVSVGRLTFAVAWSGCDSVLVIARPTLYHDGDAASAASPVGRNPKKLKQISTMIYCRLVVYSPL
jgi:hypothetical protein